MDRSLWLIMLNNRINWLIGTLKEIESYARGDTKEQLFIDSGNKVKKLGYFIGMAEDRYEEIKQIQNDYL